MNEKTFLLNTHNIIVVYQFVLKDVKVLFQGNKWCFQLWLLQNDFPYQNGYQYIFIFQCFLLTASMPHLHDFANFVLFVGFLFLRGVNLWECHTQILLPYHNSISVMYVFISCWDLISSISIRLKQFYEISFDKHYTFNIFIECFLFCKFYFEIFLVSTSWILMIITKCFSSRWSQCLSYLRFMALFFQNSIFMCFHPYSLNIF